MKSIDYKYGNLPIPGGGYITGFAYHKNRENILYLRTDIGGTYKYEYETQCWICLIDHVTIADLSETYPTAIALDDNKPEMLYIACGENNGRNGIFAVSSDYGSSFEYYQLPCKVYGNWPGRGTGIRLAVDPNNSDILYFASQSAGLLRSVNRGRDWESVSIENVDRKNELNDTFIWVNPKSEEDGMSKILVLGTAGISNAKSEVMRGHSLYVSYDAGATWDNLSMPESLVVPDIKMSGLVGHRYDFDGKYLYVTLSSTGQHSYLKEEGYSCDSGDACNGKIIRYPVADDGIIGDYENITPTGTEFEYTKDGINACGFGGISSCAAMPGLLAASTLCEKRGDMVFISKDYGDTWRVKLSDLKTNNLNFNTSYMQPKYNGGHSIIHWLSDIKINPFNPDDVIFNSGTGVFGTYNFTSDDCMWSDRCRGIEETVHINVYSPHNGDVIALDIVGDLGGFAFKDLHTPCRNSFDDKKGNRYITCMNADYSDVHPECVIVTPRGNWTGKTIGGLIISHDQCETFTHLELPFGISRKVDERLKKISQPNNNSGWVAISQDCRNIVWSVADWISLDIDAVIFSNNQGKSFDLCTFYDLYKKQITEGKVKVLSDRCNPDVFYGFSTSRIIYISKDRGSTFYQYKVDGEVPEFTLHLIDTFDKSSICPDSGKEGIFYISMVEHGIWKMKYDKEKDIISFSRITKDDVTVYKMGLGVIAEGADYLQTDKAIYATAIIDGQYGFYMSLDDAKTWTRINNENQMFGDINTIAGDSRKFGRFFIGTGSRGLIYGEPANEKLN